MKIAVTGSNGYIAAHLIERFSGTRDFADIIKIGRNTDADYHLDLEQPDQFDHTSLDGVEYVIFTSAVSSPDRCAKEYEYCWKVNVEGTITFIRKVIEREIKVLFFSSDAVYGDIPGMIYTEQSQTDAGTPYGKMKKAVEDEFCGSPMFKAIRLSYVVSAGDKFISYCIRCMQNREKAEIFHPFYRSCITRSDVENIVIWLLQNWDDFPYMCLNAAGEELVSRVRIADEINRIMGDKLDYEIKMPDKIFYENRPAITQMESLYLYNANIIKKGSFSEKLLTELKGKFNYGSK